MLVLVRRLCFFQPKLARSRLAMVSAFVFSKQHKSNSISEQGGLDLSSERWTCSCGFSNFSFRSACFHCHALSPSLSTNSTNEKISFPPGKDGAQEDNYIPCPIPAGGETYKETVRHSSSDFAVYSSSSVDSQKNISVLRPGDWKCGCGAHNFSRRTTCFSCHSPKNGQLNFLLKPGDWICSQCNAHNFKSRTECFCCHMEKPGPGIHKANIGSSSISSSSQIRGTAPWTCQSCHSINEPHMRSCLVCTADRPSSPSQEPYSPSSSFVGTKRHCYPNDWICSSCSYVNFQSRLVCKSCYAQKTQNARTVGIEGEASVERMVGKSEHSTPRGKDWSCSCGFLNFSFRETCKSCSSPKPSLDAQQPSEVQLSDSSATPNFSTTSTE